MFHVHENCFSFVENHITHLFDTIYERVLASNAIEYLWLRLKSWEGSKLKNTPKIHSYSKQINNGNDRTERLNECAEVAILWPVHCDLIKQTNFLYFFVCVCLLLCRKCFFVGTPSKEGDYFVLLWTQMDSVMN